jgi:hypothetical protein
MNWLRRRPESWDTNAGEGAYILALVTAVNVGTNHGYWWFVGSLLAGWIVARLVDAVVAA